MKERNAARRNIAALVLVLLAMTAYLALVQRGAPTFYFSPQERTISLSGAKDTSAGFALDDLEALELSEGGDYGAALDGGRLPLGGVCYGTWESESLGRYEAFLSDRIGAAIVLGDGDRTAVFNLESEESTRELFGQLTALRANAE